MCNLHDPAARLVALDAPALLFAARANVWRVVARPYGLLSRLAEESGIGAQMLQDAGTHGGAANAQRIEDGFKLGDIMTIRPGHDDRERGATLVYQEHSLAPIFSPGPSGWVRPTLAQAAPSPSPRQRFAIAKRYLPYRHTPLARPATDDGTSRPAPTPGISCGRRWRCRSVPWVVLSTDTRYAVRTLPLQTRSEAPWACDRHRACVRSAFSRPVDAPESRARLASRTHRQRPMTVVCSLPSFSPSMRTSRDGEIE